MKKLIIIIIMCIMPILAHSQAPIMLRKPPARHKRINLRITHTIGKRLDMVGNALIAGVFASVIYSSYRASTGNPTRYPIGTPLCLGVSALTCKSIGDNMMQK